METVDLFALLTPLASPATFALLVALAAALVWLAFAPARPARQVQGRLEGYVDRRDVAEDAEMARGFASRALGPILRRLLRALGRLLPQRSLAATEAMLVQAGRPGGLSALDFVGLRVLIALLLGGGAFWLAGQGQSFSKALQIGLLLTALGFFLPRFWLRRRIRARQHEIARALPDALDMLTIGVEAGLAFESALLRVGERWDNALTREFRRAVAEMRVGMARDDALQRMARRAGVEELNSFVAVLVQSSQMGVSIAQVLHTQAAEMRTKRRQRAEELARQAGVKMVFPLVFLILPALFVVILGPGLPDLVEFFATLPSSVKGF